MLVAGGLLLVGVGASPSVALALYVALGAAVLHWGLRVYGPAGGLGALALVAFTQPLWAAEGAAAPLAGALAQLAAAYALMRCLLDPALSWALAAGAAMAAAVPAAAIGGESIVAAGLGMAAFSALLAVVRTLTAERWERRARVAQASAVSIGLAWAVAAGVLIAVARSSTLPSPDDYGDATRAAALRVARREGTAASRAQGPQLADVPIAPLLLAATRPWRRARRYTDAGWLLALACLAGPSALAAASWPAAAVAVVPLLALLAGACWDPARTPWQRRAATVAVLLQVAAIPLLPRTIARRQPPALDAPRAQARPLRPPLRGPS